MGRELGRFDLISVGFDQLTKLLTLLFCDRSEQVLNLRNAFPYEGDIAVCLLRASAKDHEPEAPTAP